MYLPGWIVPRSARQIALQIALQIDCLTEPPMSPNRRAFGRWLKPLPQPPQQPRAIDPSSPPQQLTQQPTPQLTP
jgi:hypothetical protein